MNTDHATLPATLAELDTPALCLDLDAFQANVRRVAELCQQRGVAWRPHAKCHKSQDVGTRLVEAGALGLTCAKLGEAEVMGEAGIQDLLIANMIVGEQKVARLVELRRRANPIVCIDSFEQARPIAAAMATAGLECRVILEVDIGLHRVGIPPERAPAMAAELAGMPGINFAGIMGYEGHLLTIADLEEKRAKIDEALQLLVSTAEAIRAGGTDCEIVSCGGTGSILYCTDQAGITEVQAGGAIFMDEFYRSICQVDFLDQALSVIATVVSRPAPDRAVIDAGRKTINGEICMPAVMDPPGLVVKSLSAEHGALQVPEGMELKIGDRVRLAPGYGDLTTVLHNQFYVHQGDQIVDCWPLQARGRLA